MPTKVEMHEYRTDECEKRQQDENLIEQNRRCTVLHRFRIHVNVLRDKHIDAVHRLSISGNTCWILYFFDWFG